MRGYFEIGIHNPNKECNYGTLLRSAYQLGAAGIFIIGGKFRKQSSDTCNSTHHIPSRQYENFDEFLAHRPIGSKIIAVESPEYGGKNLQQFYHPPSAVYILGNESIGLPDDIVKKCDGVVSIESVRTPSFNVAMAGTIIMYDRMIKQVKTKI